MRSHFKGTYFQVRYIYNVRPIAQFTHSEAAARSSPSNACTQVCESIVHRWCKQGVYPGFEIEGRHHQKSKTGVISGPTKRTDVVQKKLKEKEGLIWRTINSWLLFVFIRFFPLRSYK